MSVDEPAASITIAWRGPVPDGLRRQLAGTGLTVTFTYAAYDASTLAAATRAGITPRAAAALAAVGVQRARFEPSPDGNGLELGYLPLDPSRPVDEAAVRAAFQSVTGVPVVHLYGGPKDVRVQPFIIRITPSATPTG